MRREERRIRHLLAEMSENHEEKKARQKAAKIRAAEKGGGKPDRPRLDVEDWERWELDALPQRQQRAERRTEPLGKIVDRLRAESAEAAADSWKRIPCS